MKIAPAIQALTDSKLIPDQHIRRAKPNLLLLILVEAVLFAGLITVFRMLRRGPVPWPPAGQPSLPLGVAAANILVLLISGFSIHLASKSLKAGRYIAFLEGLEVAAWSGFLFLAVQGADGVRLILFGLNHFPGLLGGLFYLLVGLYGLQAFGGLWALFWMKGRAARGEYAGLDVQAVELCRMYWYWVVGLWPILFVLVYP